ncbi:hypothetical protein PSEUBRA_006097 [Kalmanozyma brasiliensis GHG001]|uniref:Uncharacterized protein n=1 Tax=Kalmanozyma brasiliensis (strain GHG001) TaxID=1365824 RepID=V5EPD3_KALBG|nr:uncharacterized protein PSEUBRA_006097 [Kalmanozyma brasiliensis GHG001]EST04798.1 hypothetical protein PSEUBRA_006097 [Kalmanozyma brasiliensis GHG001]
MPYQYLTFSDLYEEQVRSSAPSSPVMSASSLSPVFLLPSTSQRSSASRSPSHRCTTRDVHGHSTLQTHTQDSDDVPSPSTSPSSSSALHLDLLRLFRRRSSIKSWSKKHSASNSVVSTPTSSRRSSFTSGFALVSAASSANTSPAISRQPTRRLSEYEEMLQKTVRAEEEDERQRQSELRAYFEKAGESGLGLKRF